MDGSSTDFDNTVYDRLRVASEAMTLSEENTDNGYTSADARTRAVLRIKPMIPVVLIWAAWAVIAVLDTVKAVHLIQAVFSIDISRMSYSVPLLILSVAAPAALWIGQSHFEHFGTFLNRKILTLCIAAVSITLAACQLFYAAGYYLLMPAVFHIPARGEITPGMVIGLAKGVLSAVTAGPGIWLAVMLFKRIFDPHNRSSIEHFVVDRNFDTRKNRKYAYDARFVRRVDDGSMYVVKEKDRFLHMLADGTTGTGKTSSIFNVEIVGDLNQKVTNTDELKTIFHRLVLDGDLRILHPFDDRDFSVFNFEPVTDKGEKEYNRCLKTIQNAGITVVAPNSSFGDDVYEFATKRGFRVNRVDPTLGPDGRHKPGFIGFNPLYIDPEKKGLDRRIEINAKACLFADVLQAVYDSGSKGDPYFASVNRNVTTSVTIMLELTFEGFHGRQPNPEDVQKVCNNFDRARDYLDALREMPDHEDYQFVIDFVDFNLLGAGRKTMETQASGLRMLINDLLINPLFKSVLCAENSIDLDRVLRNGEITVVNYATELGMSQAMAFGMFFAFSFNNAVTRRPGNESTRVPHFYYIDEFPLLLHPNMETCFTYFRQFRVCTNVAIQSVDQVRKNPSTSYFESVLLGNTGTQIFFGRISPLEMQIIEKLGGTEEKLVEQQGVTENAMTMDNTQMTFTTRTSTQDVSRVSGGSARYMDFQHVIMFSTDSGNAVPPFEGKVGFVEKHERQKVRRVCYDDWADLYRNAPAVESLPDSASSEGTEKHFTLEMPSKQKHMPEQPTGNQAYGAYGNDGEKDDEDELIDDI